MELRNKLLDAKDAAKERKIVLQDERMKARDARLQAIYSDKKDKPLEDNKLFELQEKLLTAEDALIHADIEVEVVRARIESYKMLVHLESHT